MQNAISILKKRINFKWPVPRATRSALTSKLIPRSKGNNHRRVAVMPKQRTLQPAVVFKLTLKEWLEAITKETVLSWTFNCTQRVVNILKSADIQMFKMALHSLSGKVAWYFLIYCQFQLVIWYNAIKILICCDFKNQYFHGNSTFKRESKFRRRNQTT